jgi:hypothetical protein
MGNPSWSSWTKVHGITTNYGVSALAVSNATDTGFTLYLAVADQTDTLQISTFDGSSWSGWTALPGVSTAAKPLIALNPDGGLSLYVTGTDQQVYVNNASKGTNWSAAWTPVTGAKSNFGLCASADWNLYLVGLSGHIWTNSNPPSGDWTKLVIDGNDFRTNAALYSGPPDAVQVGCTLYAKGFDDDKIWICNPTGEVRWTEFSPGGLTYVGLGGAPLFPDDETSSVLFLTGRHNEIMYCYNTLNGSAPWKTIDGFKTNAALAATPVNSLTEDGELSLCSVYLFGKGLDEGDVRYAVGQWTEE